MRNVLHTRAGLNLVWNQPHAIFLAELEYRAAKSDTQRL
jgi:hypothetical protein|eukprot:COSAG01_NODE_3111_length_6570_cov_10.045743_6_plen_39_part_00